MERANVALTQEQRNELEKFSTTGTRSAKAILRARALLLLDAGEAGPAWTIQRASIAVGFSTRALKQVKAQFIAEGLNATIMRKTPFRDTHANGPLKTRLIELVCRKPPTGCVRWSLRLLRNKLIEEGVVASVSLPTIGALLRKANLDLTISTRSLRNAAARM